MRTLGRISRRLDPRPWPRKAARKLRNTEAGQSLVEFAMVLPFFLVLLFALVDFGRAFYGWLLVTNAAREGARAAALQMSASNVDTAVWNSLCKSYPTNCQLPNSKITITHPTIQGTRGDPTKVTVTYAFTYATPLGSIVKLIPGGGSTLTAPTISGYSEMRFE